MNAYCAKNFEYPLPLKNGAYDWPPFSGGLKSPVICYVLESRMLKPLNDHIVVKRLEQESVSKGGIIIPDNAKEKPTKAVVMAVGSGKLDKNGKRIEMGVKVGEVVLFGKYSGSEVKLNGEEYMILREDDVLAVVEE